MNSNSSRSFSIHALLALTVLLQACSVDRSAPAEGKNLLLITMDTTRLDSISCYGGDPRNTPHIDQLARGGVRFENAYSQTNVTNPSHVSILTGQSAYEHGVFSNFIETPKPLRAIQLAFQEAGYRTGAFLSVDHLIGRVKWAGFDQMPVVEGRIPGQLVANEVTDLALAWLEEESDKPFFGWVHYFDPHSPCNPPLSYRLKYYPGDPSAGELPLLSEDKNFAAGMGEVVNTWLAGVRDAAFPLAMYNAEIRFVDDEIGRLLLALERASLMDDTVVVLVADHGESLGEHGLQHTHAGLYEVSLRIPFVVRVPGMLAGVVEPALVSHLDIAPTLSELFGLEPSLKGSGKSLVPLLSGVADEELRQRDLLIFESTRNLHVAVRKGRWKLIWSNAEQHPRLPSESQLFDLEADPGEIHNVFAQQPDIVEELRRAIEPWIQLGKVANPKKGEIDPEVLDRLEQLGYR